MTLEQQYKQVLTSASHGFNRDDRTGVGCTSIFAPELTWDLSAGKFPMLTGRRIFPKVFKTEFEWFINGETNIKRFQDNNVKIWDAWADDEGELGPVYGHQLRNYNSEGIDQLSEVIYQLKNNPDSRRHIISLWNVSQLDDMALPPCYNYFQFFVEGDKLNMFVNQRSADILLGIPYDLCLFSMLLLYVAEQTGLQAARVKLNMVDAHVYNNQREAVADYLAQDTHDLPDYEYKDGELTINNYKWSKYITAEVAV